LNRNLPKETKLTKARRDRPEVNAEIVGVAKNPNKIQSRQRWDLVSFEGPSTDHVRSAVGKTVNGSLERFK
jgi:hypothetical protein